METEAGFTTCTLDACKEGFCECLGRPLWSEPAKDVRKRSLVPSGSERKLLLALWPNMENDSMKIIVPAAAFAVGVGTSSLLSGAAR